MSDPPELLLTTTEPGRALLAEATRLARAHPAGDPELLRAATALRRTHPAALVATAFALADLRVAAQAKSGHALDLLLTRAGLEQMSADAVAVHRATRLRSELGAGAVADLCCGLGSDTMALAAGGPVTAVDRDPTALRFLEYNAAVCGVQQQLTTLLADVRSVDCAPYAGVFVDPARRGTGGRTPGRTEPPLDWCLGLAAQVPAVVVKAAPGLATTAVPSGWEREYVAVGRDLRETALWSPALARATSRATVLTAAVGPARTATLLPAPDSVPAPVRSPGSHLLDPNPAVTRAGLVAELAAGLDAWQIDARIAFLSANHPLQTPFGRSLLVEASLPWHHRRLAEALRALDVGAVDIRRRGLAGDVDAVRRRLRLTGSRHAVLVMTRNEGAPWALVCTPLVPTDEPGPDG